jgi:hypothetical protein
MGSPFLATAARLSSSPPCEEGAGVRIELMVMERTLSVEGTSPMAKEKNGTPAGSRKEPFDLKTLFS